MNNHKFFLQHGVVVSRQRRCGIGDIARQCLNKDTIGDGNRPNATVSFDFLRVCARARESDLIPEYFQRFIVPNAEDTKVSLKLLSDDATA